MRILSIETSCDETAVSLVEAEGGLTEPHFTVLGNSLFSQIDIHKEYGGVFPMLAKREHAKNLPPLLMQTLIQASKKIGAEKEKNEIDKKTCPTYSEETWTKIETMLTREQGLFELFKATLEHVGNPGLDAIAVTSGPGLEPALWVGISFALALGELWGVPVIPVNHMEGHIVSVLIESADTRGIAFPALALLISGGHTEIVEIENWGTYTVLGETRDDAVGEAFDKVARLLGLPYPGGPKISELAEKARMENLPRQAVLPRPMIHSGDLNFSFSGLKTAVLYYLRDHGELTETGKQDIAREFEDAVTDVLRAKTEEALDITGAHTLIIAGGVIANKKIRETFSKLEKERKDLVVKTPTHTLATDNALMIASAAYVNICLDPEILKHPHVIKAEGNMRLGKK